MHHMHFVEKCIAECRLWKLFILHCYTIIKNGDLSLAESIAYDWEQ